MSNKTKTNPSTKQSTKDKQLTVLDFNLDMRQKLKIKSEIINFQLQSSNNGTITNFYTLLKFL